MNQRTNLPLHSNWGNSHFFSTGLIFWWIAFFPWIHFWQQIWIISWIQPVPDVFFFVLRLGKKTCNTVHRGCWINIVHDICSDFDTDLPDSIEVGVHLTSVYFFLGYLFGNCFSGHQENSLRHMPSSTQHRCQTDAWEYVTVITLRNFIRSTIINGIWER